MNVQEIVLQADHLRLEYGRQLVAEDLSLTIRRAQITAIIGPNGSGKSTLLKAMARLLPPAAGRLTLLGKDLWQLSEKQAAQKIAFMPQSAILPPDLTVAEVVRMGRLPHRSFWSSFQAADEEICQQVMELTGLTSYAQRPLGSLSGGERQRARLALALAQQPEILLLDEPTTYLDIRHQLELMNIVQELHRSLGLTVLMVLHDLNQAVRYSQRLVALKKGRIIADGPVVDVFDSELVRELYGVENEIKAVEVHGHVEHVFFPAAVCGEV
ncbi:putative iron compound ABC transporter ATP-binding protein [Selenomonas ruminantium subsp. lactilytica TAM6421]|uniref:Putative iron compound ABC transporter ATP-binding protein n=1 Tax=Selenomonas ruminantium subsp. lactilytica (strain NBRC 103574 / TAM6421) TaxID=927704 RepID=I0GQ45_SELRL|nr:ABC transporter ATP-binding protein [Selenomonas ruminantium]BAL82882.1 putative iron compound ABC transporter ATP-binding protein [Selenomonas ruminantium subsp. lactilytica TAM6421]